MYSLKKITVAVTFLGCFTGGSSSFAGTDPGSLEDVLVTGTYSPRAQITSDTSVIDADEIQALNKRSVAGLLKTLPGVLVEQQGGPGGLTAVSIRGAEANFTLVLLDGVPVNDPTNSRGGGYDFSNLNPVMIERIEVVRGAQSAIYGSDALAGVINIITRRVVQGHTQSVSYEAGEDDFQNLALAAAGEHKGFEYGIQLSQRDDGEPVEGSTRENDSASVNLRWQASESQHLSASYRYVDGERTSYPEQSGGSEYAATDDLDESEYTDTIINLSWQVNFTQLWTSTLSANRFEHEEDYSSPGIFPYDEVPPNGAETDFQRDMLQWVNRLEFSPIFELNVGADYRKEEGDSYGFLEFYGSAIPTDFSLDRSSTGVFVDSAINPIEDLLIQAGVRYDDSKDYGGETTFHLGADYGLGGGFSLVGNWGEAYKLPSFFALGHALVGNPDLLPERVTSWDLGVGWRLGNDWRLGATYFNNDFEDLIDFDPETFQNVNRSRVETSGYELQADWQASTDLHLRAQATYTDIDVKNDESILTGRPEWTAGVVADWAISQSWNTALDYRWTGEQFAGSRHTGELVYQELDSFHRLDWVLRWQPLTILQLQLSVDNLLDEDYQTAVGFPAPGRTVRLGFQLSHR